MKPRLRLAAKNLLKYSVFTVWSANELSLFFEYVSEGSQFSDLMGIAVSLTLFGRKFFIAIREFVLSLKDSEVEGEWSVMRKNFNKRLEQSGSFMKLLYHGGQMLKYTTYMQCMYLVGKDMAFIFSVRPALTGAIALGIAFVLFLGKFCNSAKLFFNKLIEGILDSMTI